MPIVISCFDNSQEEEAHQQEAMAAFSSASMTALKSNPNLMATRKTYKFLMKHIDRRSHFLSYMKCSDKGCSHCSRQPITSQKSFALLQSSGGMFTPTQDPAHPGHFKTFLQMISDTIVLGKCPQAPDAYLPQHGPAALGFCDKCQYVYLSSADENRHKKIAHPDILTESTAK